MSTKYAGSVAYKEAAVKTATTGERLRVKNLTTKPYFADVVAGEPSQVVKDTQLVEAAIYGDTDRIRVLITSGANIKTADNSPLRLAAANGHTECVQVLLASGADGTDKEALVRAAKAGYDDVVALLAPKADPAARDAAIKLASEGRAQASGAFGACRVSPQDGHARAIEILATAKP